MYKLLLILKYLRRKLAPLFAAMAVMLCTAMVIIVISVMGGFLELMRHAAQRLTGQVTISADMSGFPNYQDLLEELDQLPEVQAATSVIRAYGLVNLYNRVFTVEVLGVDPKGLDEVADYRSTLYWTSKHLIDDLNRHSRSLGEMTQRERAFYESRVEKAHRIDLRELGMTFKSPSWSIDSPSLPGIVLGIEVNPYNQRNSDGQYPIGTSSLGSELTLTVMPLTRRGTVMEPSVRRVVVANEFKSGLYEVDANRVYVPFDLLQKMLKMDVAQLADPETGLLTGQTQPARTGEIMIRGKENVALKQLYKAVSSAVNQFEAAHPNTGRLWVQTWQQRHATLLGAVEKEKLLLTFLFAVISVVAVAMIGVIFYMIVLEKTRDIGVLRAIGASRYGIMSIFLGYGLAIGCVGSAAGLALAATVVYRINEIQDFLTEHFNFTMWDPTIYYFDQVPSQLDATEAAVIVCVAIFSSVLGSLLPAYLAGRQDPVESLRYE